MTSALVRSSVVPVQMLVFKVCSARADAATSPLFRDHRCSASRCLRVWPICPMYTLGHPLQGIEYITHFRWSSGTGSLGCTSMCREGAHWTKGHLDVQLCEDPSHCLRETIDVGQGYSCFRFPDIYFCLCLVGHECLRMNLEG